MYKYNYEEIVCKLYDELGIDRYNEVICAFLHESRTTGDEDAEPDIDILIVMQDWSNLVRRKSKQKIQDLLVEDTQNNSIGLSTIQVNCETATLQELGVLVERASKKGDYSYWTCICHGEMIDQIGFKEQVEELQQEVMNAYVRNAVPRLDDDEIESRREEISSDIETLKKGLSIKKDDKFLYYYLLADIKDFYCDVKGYPHTNRRKTLKVFSDESYRKSIYGDIEVAEPRFIELFLRCVEQKFTKEEAVEKGLIEVDPLWMTTIKSRSDKVVSLEDLWEFTTKDMEKTDIASRAKAIMKIT